MVIGMKAPSSRTMHLQASRMFSGRISQAVASQIEKKISENNDLNSLSNSELADLAIEFVGDAPPSHVPRETVIEIPSQQPEINFVEREPQTESCRGGQK